MPEFKTERIEFRDKLDVLKLHVLIKCFEEGYTLSSAEISCLVELHQSGYSNDFLKSCVNKKFFKDIQCVRNSLTKMKNQGVLVHKKRGNYELKEGLIPKTKDAHLIFQYMIRNP